MPGFATLHAHSEYSLRDGCMQIDDYLDRLESLEIGAAALVDTHNLFGAFKFHQRAMTRGIKPVNGADIFIGETGRTRKQKRSRSRRLRVLVENETGYGNLSYLLSQSYARRSERGLFIGHDELVDHQEGLYVLGPPSSGPGSPPFSYDPETFSELVENYRTDFGESFYVELPVYGPLNERQEKYLAAADAANVDVLFTHPAYFTTPEAVEKLPLRQAVQSNSDLAETKSLPDHREQQFVAGEAQMREWLGDEAHRLKLTESVARSCYFEFKTDAFHLPVYPDTGEQDSADYLEQICRSAAAEQELAGSEAEVEARLEEELKIINSRGFADYFLIVADIVNWARKEGIVVGPGRGSAAGSLVAYLLGITEIDPLAHDLIFERFLNRQRREMPDIDLDFADRRRQEVIEYICRRFGGESVAHIITFGQLKARNSLRDVGRVRNEPQEKIERLLDSFPRDVSEPLSVVKERFEGVEKALEDESIEEWYTQAQQLEGLVRNASVHAAGILIGEGQLARRLPLYYSDDEQALPASQFDMYDLTKLGYLKLDILGLTTLTLLELTREKIPADQRPEITELPDADPAVAELLVKKSLEGVFQFETSGNRDLVRRMAPEDRKDLMDCIALYRPGPLQSGIVDTYLKRRRGEEEVSYPHPDLEDILEDTYGLIIYQEQVMAIARRVAGFSWSRADDLRKAMGKKKTELMSSMREEFVAGAGENNYDKQWAGELFETLANFAQYGFNRSHSAAYAEITYRTAYLKAHFPRRFYAALCTVKSNDRDRIGRISGAMEEDGLELLPPRVNKSEAEFKVESEAVRYGLQAVKHVGKALARAITETQDEEPFEDLGDFLSRVPPQNMRPSVFQSLAAAGYFDPFVEARGQLVENAESLVRKGASDYKAREAGQEGLFDEQTTPYRSLADGEGLAWSIQRRSRAQKEALGFHTGSDPLEPFEGLFSFAEPGRVQKFVAGESDFGGNVAPHQLIALCEESYSSGENRFLQLHGEAEELALGVAPAVNELPNYRVVLCELGEVNSDQCVTEARPLRRASTPGLEIHFTVHQKYDQLEQAKELLTRFEGDSPVKIVLHMEEEIVCFEAPETVKLEPELARRLKQLLGPGHTALFLAKNGQVD